jgi:hypothetical protein
MNPSRKFVLALILLGAAVTGGIEGKHLIGQRSQINSLRAQLGALQAESDRIQKAYAVTTAALAQARAKIDPGRAGIGTENNLLPESDQKAWLTRTHQLKQLFIQRPDQVIPEMKLLTDHEWVYSARNAAFDTDEHIRQALASMRSHAKYDFVGKLNDALHGYTEASGGQLPPDILQLVPYFKTPPDPAMLDRYHMTRAGSIEGNASDYAIEEKSVIDPENDDYMHVQATGGFGGGSGPGAELQPEVMRAIIAFQSAHPGNRPDDPAELLPYFNPPLDPAREKRFLELINRAKAAKP